MGRPNIIEYIRHLAPLIITPVALLRCSQFARAYNSKQSSAWDKNLIEQIIVSVEDVALKSFFLYRLGSKNYLFAFGGDCG